ncbi:CehA/McbA family metallohydrolase [Paenibacillus donghaensis]|uniref:Polymerase/histidinol phosphatase N-terminal domain-containing protein n=1 Tax=Paenibacillus donghaensis TaxID=414771 RepID=A0A2Z2K7L5_9BACL|nr:CehA/McbA family metallohydrolase [Paenibacillus donghaensis]ASA22476.1 hypothetical protein B9T62_17815 [Paenibacillus donghaensis]
MTLRWLACELHTHTIHSDAAHTLEEMAGVARELELDWIALTDHNTVSGWAGKERVEREQGIRILPGLEWTTFYGHMLTLGANVLHKADWRLTGPDDIDEGISGIHQSGGLAGIAHPFRMGSPICTGCFWEFAIGKWRALDYIEVWNGTSPNTKAFNERAYRFWTELLNLGIRLPAVSGRDWHHSQVSKETTIAVTYLGIGGEGALAGQSQHAEHAELSPHVPAADWGEQQLLEAIRQGSASVTLGPLLTLQVRDSGSAESSTAEIGRIYQTGEVVGMQSNGSSRWSVTIEADFEVRKRQWMIAEQELRLRLVGSKGTVAEWGIPAASVTVEACPDLSGELWLRAELYGSMNGQTGLLAFTNCIYVEEQA